MTGRDQEAEAERASATVGRAFVQFAGAQSASEFCQSWLAIQCQLIGNVRAGLLLLEEGGRFAPAAIWPERTLDVTHLAEAAERSLSRREGLVLQATETAGGGPQVAYPIVIKERLFGVVVVLVTERPPQALQDALRQLLWGAGWLETLFRRRSDSAEGELLARRGAVLQALATASEATDPRATALALATDLATRLGCQHVALALRRPDGQLRLLAISHNAWFDSRTRIVDAFENAMEEALDQATTIILPRPEGAPSAVDLAHHGLLRLSGARAVLTVPLAHAGRAIGAITLLMSGEGARFSTETIRIVETIGVLGGPLLAARQEANRLVGGRILQKTGAFLRLLLGPRRPALKLAVIAAVAGLIALSVATGEFRITAKANVEGALQQAAVAPFDGFIATAPRRAGDRVNAGELLASLDDHELALEAIRWRSEQEQQLIRYREALGKHDRPAMRIASALATQAEAQVMLAEEKQARAKILAPFNGLVVSGDLSQMLGSPIERGKLLFEIAPIDAYRVILNVDERDIGFVAPGRTGSLILTGFATERFGMRVTKITPVASVQDGRNVFRVEAELTGDTARLRPGLEGIGKIDVEERTLLWIWTRPLLDWLRLTSWQWLG